MTKVPAPDRVTVVERIPHLQKEMLDYCAASAVESGVEGALSYDYHTDQVIYHLPIRDMDADIFPILRGTEEIWIITQVGGES